MRIWVCLWIAILLSVASAEDWSVHKNYSAFEIDSDFKADLVRIVNNANTSLERVVLHPPNRVMVVSFWQICGSEFCIVPHTTLGNCTAMVMLAEPIETEGTLLMVYKDIGSPVSPVCGTYQGSPPRECIGESCPDVVFTPVIKREAPPQMNNLIFVLLLVVVIMGIVLTMDRLTNVIPLPGVDSSKLDELFAMRDALNKSPTRSKILGFMDDGRWTCARLAKKFRISQAGMKKHMDKLEGAGLVERETKEGRKHKWYSLTEKGKRLVE